MKQQIIAIIEKEEFISNLDESYIDIMWDTLNNKHYITLSIYDNTVTTEVSFNFVKEYKILISKYNLLLIMSDSDIVNFKNNLKT